MVWVPSRVCVSDQWWSSHRTPSRVWWCSEALISYHYSSVGKESTCHAGDPSSTPGSGRSTEEGIGYPLLYSWVSLVILLVKNPPAMQETWVWSLGWEDPLEKGKTTHSSILAWRIPWTVYSPWGSQKVGHNWETFVFISNEVLKKNSQTSLWERFRRRGSPVL